MQMRTIRIPFRCFDMKVTKIVLSFKLNMSLRVPVPEYLDNISVYAVEALDINVSHMYY